MCMLAIPAFAQQQMPDPSQIHGKALPAPELPDSTVTVRVVRESIGNNVAGQLVRVTDGRAFRQATTDDQGRAEFRNLPGGSDWRAETTVDGEVLTSDPFTVPDAGGLRVILVAGIAQAAERRAAEADAAMKAPPVKGTVVLGENSRVLMQFSNDNLQVFYVLEIVNNARSRVDIGGPLLIDLPTGAAGAGTLEGSSSSATVNGDRITVVGPFDPGTTMVQVGYQLRYTSSDVQFTQTWPVAMQRVTVGIQRAGALAVTSPQFVQTSDLRSEDGTVFIVGNGPGLPAGGTLTINLSNLPIHSRMPRYVALSLAALMVGLGIWLSTNGRRERTISRGALMTRRDALLKEIEQLETKRRSGTMPAETFTGKRQRLVGELEQVYADLDEAGQGSQGGGEGAAA